jgi:hypothetical protein
MVGVLIWQSETRAPGKDLMQEGDVLGLDPYLTFSANLNVGYRQTQFFESHHDAVVGDWDSRIEGWLPPFRTNLSWGPFVRFAGVAASRDPAWENGLQAAPGGGFQVYPFSFPAFREPGNLLGKILGPLRLFGEYNRLDIWGKENRWRPDGQVRAGAEYWRARHVNETSEPVWTEIWTGLFWQSANEFDQNYDALIFANSLRAGIRIPNAGWLSTLSPYATLESSWTSHPGYYWENRLLVGGGLRFSPSREGLPEGFRWINRMVVFAEYLHVAAHYYHSAPSSIPDYDVRAGLSLSVGRWYW